MDEKTFLECLEKLGIRQGSGRERDYMKAKHFIMDRTWEDTSAANYERLISLAAKYVGV
jgi:hypothetical protein